MKSKTVTQEPRMINVMLNKDPVFATDHLWLLDSFFS